MKTKEIKFCKMAFDRASETWYNTKRKDVFSVSFEKISDKKLKIVISAAQDGCLVANYKSIDKTIIREINTLFDTKLPLSTYLGWDGIEDCVWVIVDLE